MRKILQLIYSAKTPSLLASILFLGAILRLFMLGLQAPQSHPDTDEYIRLAKQILAAHCPCDLPIGFPLMLSGFWQLFGEKYYLNAALGLNFLMSVACIYFVYRISFSLFRQENTALLAALLVAIFPSQLNFSRYLLTEMPASTFLLAGYAAYFSGKKAWAGLFLGFAIILRPPLLLVVFCFGLYTLYLSLKEKKFPPYNKWLLASYLLPILCVGMYCQQQSGAFSLGKNLPSNIILSVHSCGAEINFDPVDLARYQQPLLVAVKEYVQFAYQNPLTFAQQRLASLWELWGFWAGQNPYSTSRSFASRLMIGLCKCFLLFLGLMGYFQNRKKDKILMLLFPVLSITIVHVLLFSTPRYTFPAEAFLLIFAAAAGGKYLQLRNPT